jgi:hypothetical protein
VARLPTTPDLPIRSDPACSGIFASIFVGVNVQSSENCTVEGSLPLRPVQVQQEGEQGELATFCC